ADPRAAPDRSATPGNVVSLPAGELPAAGAGPHPVPLHGGREPVAHRRGLGPRALDEGHHPIGGRRAGRRVTDPAAVSSSTKRRHHLAQLGICVQFLALVRSLAEVFRLEHIHGRGLPVSSVAPYVGGGLLAALLTWVAVLCYFAGRDRTAIGVAAATI